MLPALHPQDFHTRLTLATRLAAAGEEDKVAEIFDHLVQVGSEQHRRQGVARAFVWCLAPMAAVLQRTALPCQHPVRGAPSQHSRHTNLLQAHAWLHLPTTVLHLQKDFVNLLLIFGNWGKHTYHRMLLLLLARVEGLKRASHPIYELFRHHFPFFSQRSLELVHRVISQSMGRKTIPNEVEEVNEILGLLHYQLQLTRVTQHDFIIANTTKTSRSALGKDEAALRQITTRVMRERVRLAASATRVSVLKTPPRNGHEHAYECHDGLGRVSPMHMAPSGCSKRADDSFAGLIKRHKRGESMVDQDDAATDAEVPPLPLVDQGAGDLFVHPAPPGYDAAGAPAPAAAGGVHRRGARRGPQRAPRKFSELYRSRCRLYSEAGETRAEVVNAASDSDSDGDGEDGASGSGSGAAGAAAEGEAGGSAMAASHAAAAATAPAGAAGPAATTSGASASAGSEDDEAEGAGEDAAGADDARYMHIWRSGAWQRVEVACPGPSQQDPALLPSRAEREQALSTLPATRGLALAALLAKARAAPVGAVLAQPAYGRQRVVVDAGSMLRTQPEQLFNDSLIDGYALLLKAAYPSSKIAVVNSFIAPSILNGSRPLDAGLANVFNQWDGAPGAYDLVLMPVNWHRHWMLAVFNNVTKQAALLDPMKGESEMRTTVLRQLLGWYADAARARGHAARVGAASAWKMQLNDAAQGLVAGTWASPAAGGGPAGSSSPSPAVQYDPQTNVVDCGVLVLMMMEHIFRGQPISYRASDALLWRGRIALSLWLWLGAPG